MRQVSSFFRFVAAACVAVFASLPAAPAPALLGGPDLPPGVYAYWRSTKVLALKGESHVVDLAGDNHFVAPAPWFTVSPAGGFVLDGTQTEGLRLAAKQPVSARFTLGIDLCPDLAGMEHQTVFNLYRFCELRYRKSKGELTFNVWQVSTEDRTKDLVSSLTLPLPAERWSRVRATIEGDRARLEIGDAKAERRLPGTWEFLPPAVAGIIGVGGSDRVFRGRFDHLFLALAPLAPAAATP
jgi:hypothetical protein